MNHSPTAIDSWRRETRGGRHPTKGDIPKILRWSTVGILPAAPIVDFIVTVVAVFAVLVPNYNAWVEDRSVCSAETYLIAWIASTVNLVLPGMLDKDTRGRGRPESDEPERREECHVIKVVTWHFPRVEWLADISDSDWWSDSDWRSASKLTMAKKGPRTALGKKKKKERRKF